MCNPAMFSMPRRRTQHVRSSANSRCRVLLAPLGLRITAYPSFAQLASLQTCALCPLWAWDCNGLLRCSSPRCFIAREPRCRRGSVHDSFYHSYLLNEVDELTPLGRAEWIKVVGACGYSQSIATTRNRPRNACIPVIVFQSYPRQIHTYVLSTRMPFPQVR